MSIWFSLGFCSVQSRFHSVLSRFSLVSLLVFARFNLGFRSVLSWVFVFLVQMILFSFINILCHTALHDSMIHVLPFQSWGDFKFQVLPRTWGVQLFKRNRISFLLKNIPPCTWESLWGKLYNGAIVSSSSFTASMAYAIIIISSSVTWKHFFFLNEMEMTDNEKDAVNDVSNSLEVEPSPLGAGSYRSSSD